MTVIRQDKNAEAARKAQAGVAHALANTVFLCIAYPSVATLIGVLLYGKSILGVIIALCAGMIMAYVSYQMLYVMPTQRYRQFVDDKTIIEVTDPQIMMVVSDAQNVRAALQHRYDQGVYDDVLRLTTLLESGDQTGDRPNIAAEVAQVLHARNDELMRHA